MVALFAAVPAVVLGAVGLLAAGPSSAAVVLVVVAAALAAWARFGGERRVLAAIGGRDADPVADARLWNLAEGLSIGAGVRQPRLRVIDSPGLNAMAAGTRPNRAIVGVTAGLLAELDRIELEAVLAEELIQVRRQETVPATVLAATFGLGRGLAVAAGPGRPGGSGGGGLDPIPAGAGGGPGEARGQRPPSRASPRRWPTS